MKTIHDARYVRLIATLRVARLSKELTQLALANRLGCSRPVVSCVESGQRRLDVIELVDICQVLDLDIYELVSKLEE